MKPFKVHRPDAARVGVEFDFGLRLGADFSKGPRILPACPSCFALHTFHGSGHISCRGCRRDTVPGLKPGSLSVAADSHSGLLEWLIAADGGPDPLAAILLANDVLDVFLKAAQGYEVGKKQMAKKQARQRMKSAKKERGLNKRRARTTVELENRFTSLYSGQGLPGPRQPLPGGRALPTDPTAVRFQITRSRTPQP